MNLWLEIAAKRDHWRDYDNYTIHLEITGFSIGGLGREQHLPSQHTTTIPISQYVGI